MFLNIELYEVQTHEIKLTPHLNLVAHTCTHNCFFLMGTFLSVQQSKLGTKINMQYTPIICCLLQHKKNHLLNPNSICVHYFFQIILFTY